MFKTTFTLLCSLSLSLGWVYAAQAQEPPQVVVQWQAPQVSQRVRQRVNTLLAKVSPVRSVAQAEVCGSDCEQTPLLIQIEEDESAPAESFAISLQRQGAQLQMRVKGQGRGVLYGTYAALERLGFRFWHPLQLFVPKELTKPEPSAEVHQEQPAYKVRGFAHHTMHPLELAHVLNGWGPQGPQDQAGWEALLPEWESYLEWLIANRQNKVEWVLLEKATWKQFARSPERQARLRRIVELGHQWQMQIGIDAPLALEQQNGWRLIPQLGSLDSELQQLRQNLDWLLATGLDFVTTEMGSSEFTHGGAHGTLAWLNEATDYLARKQRPFYTKIHISSGQQVQEFKDPQTGGPLNINFLPYYADSRLGIMAHTVQIYALDDPAPTYGHQDFSDMHRFMRLNSGKRPLIWYPETAYWVNYDIHVPLFLPVYGRQRWHDMALLNQEALKLDGQIIFSSGWEHGYWLNDLIAARAAWQPPENPANEAAQLQSLLSQSFLPYGEANEELAKLLKDTMDAQHRLLVLGQRTGQQAPVNVDLRNGMAYLAGQDAWSELGGMIRAAGLKGYQTQPDRLSFEALAKEPAALDFYQHELKGLLNEIVNIFLQLKLRADALETKIAPELKPWFQEIQSGLGINYLRARFVYQLMQASASYQVGQTEHFRYLLHKASASLEQAQQLIQSQVYRADSKRIAAWNVPNPTAYRYGYLWPAQQLFFWRRDLAQVSQQNFNPCLMNIIDPLNVALPDPENHLGAGFARALLPLMGLGDCVELKNNSN